VGEQQKKKHKRNKMKVSEKLNCGAAATTTASAADFSDDGLLLQRESRKTGKKNEKDD
jgi:hypothetical protein